jgi:hypothetical protein
MRKTDELTKTNDGTKEDFLDDSLDNSIYNMFTDADAQEFSFGFYEAQKAIETGKAMGISNGKYILSLFDEDLPKVFLNKEFLFADDTQMKEMNGKSAYILVIPKHSLNTLYAKDFKEIKEAMNEYLKPNGNNKKHNGANKSYKFKRITDLERVPFFDRPEFVRAYKLAKLGYLANDVKHFDLPKVHKSNIDEDLDSVCSVFNDKIKNIGNNSYLLLETQCFSESTINKKQDGYSAIIVGKLVDFKRIKTENGLEEVIGTVESIDKNDTAELFKACKEYGFKGYVGAWKINSEELVPFKYTKINMKKLK